MASTVPASPSENADGPGVGSGNAVSLSTSARWIATAHALRWAACHTIMTRRPVGRRASGDGERHTDGEEHRGAVIAASIDAGPQRKARRMAAHVVDVADPPRARAQPSDMERPKSGRSRARAIDPRRASRVVHRPATMRAHGRHGEREGPTQRGYEGADRRRSRSPSEVQGLRRSARERRSRLALGRGILNSCRVFPHIWRDRCRQAEVAHESQDEA